MTESSFVLTNDYDRTGDEVIGIKVQYTDYVHPLTAEEVLKVIHSLEEDLRKLKARIAELE